MTAQRTLDVHIKPLFLIASCLLCVGCKRNVAPEKPVLGPARAELIPARADAQRMLLARHLPQSAEGVMYLEDIPKVRSGWDFMYKRVLSSQELGPDMVDFQDTILSLDLKAMGINPAGALGFALLPEAIVSMAFIEDREAFDLEFVGRIEREQNVRIPVTHQELYGQTVHALKTKDEHFSWVHYGPLVLVASPLPVDDDTPEQSTALPASFDSTWQAIFEMPAGQSLADTDAFAAYQANKKSDDMPLSAFIQSDGGSSGEEMLFDEVPYVAMMGMDSSPERDYVASLWIQSVEGLSGKHAPSTPNPFSGFVQDEHWLGLRLSTPALKLWELALEYSSTQEESDAMLDQIDALSDQYGVDLVDDVIARHTGHLTCVSGELDLGKLMVAVNDPGRIPSALELMCGVQFKSVEDAELVQRLMIYGSASGLAPDSVTQDASALSGEVAITRVGESIVLTSKVIPQKVVLARLKDSQTTRTGRIKTFAEQQGYGGVYVDIRYLRKLAVLLGGTAEVEWLNVFQTIDLEVSSDAQGVRVDVHAITEKESLK